MSAQPWTKAQAKNNKAFESRLDKLTGYLVDGDWHGSFISFTEAENDLIVNIRAGKEELASTSIEFIRLDGGALKAVLTELDDGEIEQETFIVGIQPYQKTFTMISADDDDIATGIISKKSNTISITEFEVPQPGDGSDLTILQFTNLLA